VSKQLDLFANETKPLNGYVFTEAHIFFHKTFHDIKFSTFMDKDLSKLFGKPILDICKFDNWLHNKFGDYENRGMSMQDLLTVNYGSWVANEIKGLLG